MTGGQINGSTGFGTFLRQFARERVDILTFVELGTWDGQGSTRAIAGGLSERPRKEGGSFVPTLWSFETDEWMHAATSERWSKTPMEGVAVHLVHGRVGDDIVPLGLVKSLPDFKPEMVQWWMGEKRNMMNSPLARDVLPDHVDFVLLDGGEFTTRGDWEYVKKLSPKIIALDDTRTFKCAHIKSELDATPDTWTRLSGDDEERNGWCIFERIGA